MAASRADGMQSLNRRHLSDAAGSGLFDAYKCTAIILVGLRGFEPTRRLAKEPKGDVTLMKGLKPPECFIIALQNTYQQSEFSGAF